MLMIRNKNQEVLLSLLQKIQSCDTKKLVSLAPGAADISEGVLYLETGHLYKYKRFFVESLTDADFRMDCKISVAQPGSEGFWSVAPGCGDVSEGMVWILGR